MRRSIFGLTLQAWPRVLSTTTRYRNRSTRRSPTQWRARSKQHKGPGRSHCEECAAPIPEARRKAVPGVRLCVKCQAERDREENVFSGYNRRGSKDSQLR